MVSLSPFLCVWGGPNSGHGAEEKPATAAVTGPERTPLKSHTRQSFRAFWPLELSVLKACILWRRSGLNLDRPLHSEPRTSSQAARTARVGSGKATGFFHERPLPRTEIRF